MWFYVKWGRFLSHDPHLSVYKKKQLVGDVMCNGYIGHGPYRDEKLLTVGGWILWSWVLRDEKLLDVEGCYDR